MKRLRGKVLERLEDYAGKSGVAYPTQATLAADIGCSERTVRRHLKKLANDGLILIDDINTNLQRYIMVRPELSIQDLPCPKRAEVFRNRLEPASVQEYWAVYRKFILTEREGLSLAQIEKKLTKKNVGYVRKLASKILVRTSWNRKCGLMFELCKTLGYDKSFKEIGWILSNFKRLILKLASIQLDRGTVKLDYSRLFFLDNQILTEMDHNSCAKMLNYAKKLLRVTNWGQKCGLLRGLHQMIGQSRTFKEVGTTLRKLGTKNYLNLLIGNKSHAERHVETLGNIHAVQNI